MTVRALIPSYRPDAEQLGRLVVALDRAGACPIVLANGKPAQDIASAAGHELLSPGANRGFGPSIAWAVQRIPDWSWLLLANDDLDVDGVALARVLVDLPTTPGALIVHLDEDVARPVPNAFAVFANISLIARVMERVAPRRSERLDSYRSFSCVLISRTAWEATGGFDDRMPFTYEDADFVRRLREVGGRAEVRAGAGVHHERSKSSSRAVRAVLPVVVWSALMYLRKWSRLPAPAIQATLVGALGLRVLLVPFGRADRAAHLAGIRTSLLAVLRLRRPALPPYDPGS